MKSVVAVIKPTMLDDLRTALDEVGVTGLTASVVEGYGRQRGHTEVYRGMQLAIDLVPKTRIEAIVDDSMAELVADTIAWSVHSGTIGDGKIWVTDVETVVRIRTGETGSSAL